jgi:hypothetical protein
MRSSLPLSSSLFFPTSVTMVSNGLDLNAEPPIDWKEMIEWEGPAHELDYDLVWTGEGFCLSSVGFSAVNGMISHDQSAADGEGAADGVAVLEAFHGEGDSGDGGSAWATADSEDDDSTWATATQRSTAYCVGMGRRQRLRWRRQRGDSNTSAWV